MILGQFANTPLPALKRAVPPIHFFVCCRQQNTFSATASDNLVGHNKNAASLNRVPACA